MPVNPENAWLLLSKKHLYLMSSEQDKRYYDKLDVYKNPEDRDTVIGIPRDWFKKSRDLVVNHDLDDSQMKPASI